MKKMKKSSIDSILDPLGIFFGNGIFDTRRGTMKKSEIMETVNMLDRKVTTLNNAIASLQDKFNNLNVSDAAIDMVKAATKDIAKYKEEINTMFRNTMQIHSNSIQRVDETMETWKAIQEKNIKTALDEFGKQLAKILESMKRIDNTVSAITVARGPQ
jgi:DNA repair exonuclease SbcCD ATPase subunit